MKCKWQNYLYLSLFALLGLLCGSSIINAENSVSALSKSITYTKSEWFSYNGRVFPDCDNSCLKNYSYIKIDVNGIPFNYRYNSSTVDFVSFTNSHGSYLQLYVLPFGSTIISYDPDSLPIDYNLNKNSNYATSSDYTLTFTLYDSLLPSGSLSITENGEYDVSSYATAVVEVPDTETIIQGDYHDDLIKIYNAIMACAGVALVIYFFYCIYRMIIKSTGGY